MTGLIGEAVSHRSKIKKIIVKLNNEINASSSVYQNEARSNNIAMRVREAWASSNNEARNLCKEHEAG